MAPFDSSVIPSGAMVTTLAPAVRTMAASVTVTMLSTASSVIPSSGSMMTLLSTAVRLIKTSELAEMPASLMTRKLGTISSPD